MTDLTQLSSRDLEKLSAYLDGELSVDETERLRARLNTEPDLRGGLERLQATVAVVRDLPQVRRPRSFVLTEAAKSRAYPVLQFGTALAALAFIVVAGADFLVRGTARAPEQAMIASEEVAGLADANRSLDLATAPEVPAAEPEGEGALQFAAPAEETVIEPEMEGAAQPAAPADESAAEIGEPSPAEESPAEEQAAEVGGAESDLADEFFKADERDAESQENADLEQAGDTLSEAPAKGEADDTVIAEPEVVSRERNLLLPALRIGEIILGLAVVLLIGLSLWARRR